LIGAEIKRAGCQQPYKIVSKVIGVPAFCGTIADRSDRRFPWTDYSIPKRPNRTKFKLFTPKTQTFFDTVNKMETLSTLKIAVFSHHRVQFAMLLYLPFFLTNSHSFSLVSH
jgi:hypothetical protein